jgi:hypothetical protein
MSSKSLPMAKRSCRFVINSQLVQNLKEETEKQRVTESVVLIRLIFSFITESRLKNKHPYTMYIYTLETGVVTIYGYV